MNDQSDRPASSPQRRAHDRFCVAAEAILRRAGGNSYNVRVFDISESGCKVETVERPAVGENVWVRFAGLENVQATVSWVAPPVAGLQFERPFHPAVFDALKARLFGAGKPS